MGMKYLDTKKDSLEEAVSKAMNGDNRPSADTLVAEGGKYLKYSDLLLQKGRLMAKNQSTAMIDKEIKKEMGKLGIKEKLDPVGKEDGDVDNDGDKDASDKYLAKKRKAITKAVNKEEDVNLEEAASVFISTSERGDAKRKDSKEYTDALKKYGLKSKFVSTASKNGHEVTGRNINDITKFLSDLMGDDFKDRFKKKGNSYEDMDEGVEPLEAKTTKNVDETLDRIREANVGKGRTMRNILADIWNMGEGKNVFAKDEKVKKEEEDEKGSSKTMTGKKATKVEIEPEIE